MSHNEDLFSSPGNEAWRPLADRLRPRRLQDVVGQQHLLAAGKPLHQALQQGKLHSMIFWGPPGTGKTTLARLLADLGEAQFISLSAVLSGVKEIRAAVQQAKSHAGQSVLFVDEVHRFNKSQQDAFLPHIEDGTLLFVGATTENPSFALNNALLSRCRVYVLKPLQEDELQNLLQRALEQETPTPHCDDGVLPLLARAADGDARRALGFLEILLQLNEQGCLTVSTAQDVAAQGLRRFDKQGDVFYEQISALHKSVRGSDPDAAVYWLCRMLDGGCEPLYLGRRLVRMASEDIGNADPRALTLCLEACASYERLGSPEGELALAQAVIYLACAAKSNAVYNAYNQAAETARQSASLEVPLHIRNAPTGLMKDLGYGKDYRYAHDETDAFAAGETYLPEALADSQFYQPVKRGLEIKIGEKLHQLREKNQVARKNAAKTQKKD